MTKCFCSKKGSLSLEAAMVMPVVLMLTIWLVIQISCVETEIKVKGALDRTAAELSLLSPVCQLFEQVDLLGSDQTKTSELNQIINEISPGSSIQSILGDALLDVVSSEILGQVIQKRMDYWLAEAYSGQPGWVKQLGSRKLFMDWNLDDRQLWLCLSYELKTPLGIYRRQIASVVPLWIGQDAEQSSADNNAIWLLDNFSRGKKFRALYGANLPYDFPVIARFSDGEALSIDSIDLTAPTYSDSEEVRQKVNEAIARLADFNGTDYSRSEQSITINAFEIKSRRLLLIIPDNFENNHVQQLLDDMQAQAQSCGVKLEVVRHGSSYRYQTPPSEASP